MNPGLLPNSSNNAIRYNPTTQSLTIGDADQTRSLIGQFNLVAGQNNNLSGVSDKNIVLGSNNTITPGASQDQIQYFDFNNNGNARNIIIGTSNTVLGNRFSGSDGGCVVIGNVNNIGTTSGVAKYNSVFIGNNISVSTAYAAVAIGPGTKAADNTVAIGNLASTTTNASVSLGSQSAVTGTQGSALGFSTSAAGQFSTAIGTGARTLVNGQVAFGIGSAASNKSQASTYQLAGQPSVTTESELLCGTTGTTRILLRAFSMMSFRAQITARNMSNVAASKVWFIDGAITMNTGASTTALMGTPTVTTINGSGTDSWTATVSADTTNGALKVSVYAGGSLGVYWHARIDTVENSAS